MKKRTIALWMAMVMSVGTIAGTTGCGKADQNDTASEKHTSAVSDTTEAYVDVAREDDYDGYGNGYSGSATAATNSSEKTVYDTATTAESEEWFWEPRGCVQVLHRPG